MAHYASNRFSYWGQLGIFAAFLGAGLVIGGFVSLLPIMNKLGLQGMKGISADTMNSLMKPENADLFRWVQFISTFFLFFLPPVLYAIVCHAQKPWLHLGLKQPINIQQVGVVLLIMMAALPVVSMLQDLTEMIPWSKSMLNRFKLAEDEYNKQVEVMARMDNFKDYILSIVVIAFLPAVFEEVIFRGGIQNLLSRWIKMPVLAIIITSIIFSAIHMSYLGFLTRAALGFILGWIYYRTGSLWLSIIAHFINNAIGVTMLYLSSSPGKKIDTTTVEDHFPLWIGIVSLAILYGLFKLFDKASAPYIDRPGEEVLIDEGLNMKNIFEN